MNKTENKPEFKIKYKVIHSAYYFERELFLLEISGRYAMVYKRSGLNGGNVGKVLPFHFLQDRPPRFGDARNGIVAGYIFKEFYYYKKIVSHRKRMDQYGEGIQLVCEQLKNELASVESVEQSMDDVLVYAKDFNDVVRTHMTNDNRFDWGVLDIHHGMFVKEYS